MDIPRKELMSGFALPVYGLGAWQMGGRGEADSTNDETDIAAIQKALDLGVTHIDTAESYGAGHSEELVGRAIKGRDRKQLTIATKVSAWNQSYDDLRRSFEASLLRLGTDYVDLYMLHRFPDDDPYQMQLQLSQLRYTVSSPAAATSLAENYVGLPKV